MMILITPTMVQLEDFRVWSKASRLLCILMQVYGVTCAGKECALARGLRFLTREWFLRLSPLAPRHSFT